MTTEEGDEDTAEGNADAAPGRMLEEGGGSDSQEDESEDDDDSNNNGGGGDSYDDGELASMPSAIENNISCLYFFVYLVYHLAIPEYPTWPLLKHTRKR